LPVGSADCINYTGALLLTATYKILTNILLSRFYSISKGNYCGSSVNYWSHI